MNFYSWLENNTQLQQLVNQQQAELNQIRKSGNVDQMLQVMQKHQNELAQFKKGLPAPQPNINPAVNRNPFL